ncbi:hypothetical protein MKW98_014448 [Papaver atlanticum]|uniref:Transcription factor CBF/NF-Y/archaeal histone domain-containing protein n=1 Tax=Papaver atlanticum TaxID=357466 RepID=A0AAD4RZG2_9MAGN|nr:hypothetical protein MKW98_014448 [Papaver atlanticum]
MDLNQSVHHYRCSSPAPIAQVHNFMHVSSPMISLNNIHQQYSPNTEIGEESLQSRVLQLQRQNLQLFWHQQILEIDQLSDFKQHNLPLARIKRIMKSDEDVKMISADAPVLFSKACELFILELTLRSWLNTEESRRRTLQRIDIAKAVNRGEVLDFLVDVVPANDSQDEECEKNCGGAELSPSSNGLMNFAVFDHQF